MSEPDWVDAGDLASRAMRNRHGSIKMLWTWRVDSDIWWDAKLISWVILRHLGDVKDYAARTWWIKRHGY